MNAVMEAARGFIGVPAQRCQKRALASTASRPSWALATARSSAARNHASQGVTSSASARVTVCVRSRIS